MASANKLKRGMVVQISGHGTKEYKITYIHTGGLSEDFAAYVPKADWGTEYPATDTARLSNIITRKDPSWKK